MAIILSFPVGRREKLARRRWTRYLNIGHIFFSTRKSIGLKHQFCFFPSSRRIELVTRSRLNTNCSFYMWLRNIAWCFTCFQVGCALG